MLFSTTVQQAKAELETGEYGSCSHHAESVMLLVFGKDARCYLGRRFLYGERFHPVTQVFFLSQPCDLKPQTVHPVTYLYVCSLILIFHVSRSFFLSRFSLPTNLRVDTLPTLPLKSNLSVLLRTYNRLTLIVSRHLPRTPPIVSITIPPLLTMSLFLRR